jgi:hypothetical protein
MTRKMVLVIFLAMAGFGRHLVSQRNEPGRDFDVTGSDERVAVDSGLEGPHRLVEIVQLGIVQAIGHASTALA